MVQKPGNGYIVCHQYLTDDDEVVQSCRPYTDWANHKLFEELKTACVQIPSNSQKVATSSFHVFHRFLSCYIILSSFLISISAEKNKRQ
jgi:hypothetical protein